MTASWAAGEGSSRGMSVRCPWCEVPPGVRCISSGTGQALTLTSAHHARTAAAGAGPPVVVVDALPLRQAPAPADTPAPPTDNREDEPS